ncbi:MAG: metalloregulator ArsR/SmtB family transcription factor [Chloroflexi bacterium]|nr:metalloregulator ArsR/SmtB family transcription factor [Chloroflexota bacterium]
MGEEEQRVALQLLRALADESRLKIVGLLAHGERSVDELAEALKLRAPTVSHHLARLREATLVTMRTEGTVHLYRLEMGPLRRMSKELLSPERMASLVDEAEAGAWERKVLRQSFDGDRLKLIPMSRKKRDVILDFLASRFEPGRRYAEKQVNEVLLRHHADYATLRRELIEGGWMERDHGVYWLVDGERQPRGSEQIVRVNAEAGVRWRLVRRPSRGGATAF